MKYNKKTIIVALNNGIQKFTSEEHSLYHQFKKNFREFNELYNETYTPREYATLIVGFGLDYDDCLEEAKTALAWTKMMSRHGRYTSLLNKLGHIIGENITRFN